MKSSRRWILLASIPLILGLLAAACEEEEEGAAPTEVPTEAAASPASIASGGLLYDKWWKVVPGASEPTADQPLWALQTTNTRQGADTWRCKECHGWDYKGKDGAYGSGSHETGFPGVYDAAATKSKDELAGILRGSLNSDHDFSPQLGDEAITDLANFLRDAMIDVAQYIDYDAKAPLDADVTHGQELYASTCAVCHGNDGKTINFGDEQEPEYVGTLASDNPWEFLHKTRFGQPGTEMPSGVENGWTIEDAMDILGYAQTLPKE